MGFQTELPSSWGWFLKTFESVMVEGMIDALTPLVDLAHEEIPDSCKVDEIHTVVCFFSPHAKRAKSVLGHSVGTYGFPGE